MIRLLIFATIIVLIVYMFRNHEKVEEHFRWILGVYLTVVLVVIFYAIKGEIEAGQEQDNVAVNSSMEKESGPVIGDAPVRPVDTQKQVRYTRGAIPLEEFVELECPAVEPEIRAPDDVDKQIQIRVSVNGYDEVNASREQIATSLWYLYRINELLSGNSSSTLFNLDLVVYRELVAYDRLRQETLLAVPHDQTGFSLEAENTAVILAQKTTEETIRAALHQGYHVLSHVLYGETFPWFYEGMAAYYETLSIQEDRLLLPENRKWVPMMTGSYSKFNINSIPLRELFTMSPRIFYDYKKELNLAAAHSFVNFLMNHDDEGAVLLQQYMQLLARTRCSRPEPAAEFFDKYYPGGLENLESQWREHNLPGTDVRQFELLTIN